MLKEIDTETNELNLSQDVYEEVEVLIKYDGYLKRQEIQIEQASKLEKFKIPENIDYMSMEHISTETKEKLSKYSKLFDKRTNLYQFFIYKSILHLKEHGELIFITPRDFLKTTSSIKLNEFIYKHGTITDFIYLGDQRIFKDATPNCAIWRFELGNFTRNTNIVKKFSCVNGQLLFINNEYSIKFSDLFFVKVGAVSGADKIFANETHGNLDFVCSQTAKTGKTKKMIYNKNCEYLKNFKDIL